MITYDENSPFMLVNIIIRFKELNASEVVGFGAYFTGGRRFLVAILRKFLKNLFVDSS
jgi:hypothetical protein